MRFNQNQFDEFLLSVNAVGFFDPPKTLVSGRPGHYYINIRNATSPNERLGRLIDFAYAFALDNGIKPQSFIGVPDGATALGLNLCKKIGYLSESEVYPVNLRKTPKEGHGDLKDKYFVGFIPEGTSVAVIEDVTTTGDSLAERIVQLQRAKMNVIAAIAVANRLEFSVAFKENFPPSKQDCRLVADFVEEEYGVKYYSMTDARRIIPKAFELYRPSTLVRERIKNYGYIEADLKFFLCPGKSPPWVKETERQIRKRKKGR